MAITSASFVPEERKGGAGAGGSANGPHSAANGNSGNAGSAPAGQSTPSNHPVSGTALPKGTGAGRGTVRRGGRGGK